MSDLLDLYNKISNSKPMDLEELDDMCQEFFEKTGDRIEMRPIIEVVEEISYNPTVEMLKGINALFNDLDEKVVTKLIDEV